MVERLTKLQKQIECNYLDDGAKIIENTILANRYGIATNRYKYSIMSNKKSSDKIIFDKCFKHEFGHGFAGLSDEYHSSGS